MKCPSCGFESQDNTRFCGNCATSLQTPPSQNVSTGTATFPSYVTELTPGSVFGGRYQIIEEIGAGGMGRVFKAMDLKVHEIVQARIPDHPRIRYLKVRLFVFMGRYAEAEQQLREIERLAPSSVRLAFYWSLLFAEYKEKEKALEPLQGGYNPMASYLVAQIYCSLEMTAEALQTIQEGIATGLEAAKTYMYPYQYLINNPYHHLLLQEQEYQDIVAQQKRVYDRMVEQYRGL